MRLATLPLTTGLGATENIIVHGNELVAYLDAFCFHASTGTEQRRSRPSDWACRVRERSGTRDT